jgi:signal transduction histidine kinase
MALLLAGLVIAQIISFLTIVLTPPPRPPVYRLTEVVETLRGATPVSRWGRPLLRSHVANLPEELRAPPPDRGRMSRLLAAELGEPETSVRLVEYGPSAEWRLVHWAHQLERREPPPPERGGDGRGPDGRGPDGRGPEGHGMGDDHGFGPPPPWRRHPGVGVVGEFVAAAKDPAGGWTVVRSAPEPFPSEWQLRTSLCLLIGLLIVAPAGYLFARRITAPLQRFADAAEALGRDPHGPLMTLTGPAEIGAAAQAFNEMQVRLRRYIDDRTAMVGAISHDLRTPLARIRFKVESAPPVLRESVLRDVAQMEQMIGAVLAFIRDEGVPRQREAFDLLSLLECVADDAAGLGRDVELVGGAPVIVNGDPVGLRRLFENLIDNAVKYGDEARVSLREADGAAVVEIADRGPGVAPEDLARVFQPFFRTDRSRNLDNAGVGLGLPIARATARAHGGDVELVRGAVGMVAVVTLPTHLPTARSLERRGPQAATQAGTPRLAGPFSLFEDGAAGDGRDAGAGVARG